MGYPSLSVLLEVRALSRWPIRGEVMEEPVHPFSSACWPVQPLSGVGGTGVGRKPPLEVECYRGEDFGRRVKELREQSTLK